MDQMFDPNYMNNHHEYHDEVSIPMAYGPEHAHTALSHSEMTLFWINLLK